MKKLFLIITAALLLLLTGCNPLVSGNRFDKLVKIKNFEKYTGLGAGNKNTARSARSLTTDYLTSCGLFGQNPDGTYELLIFEDEEGYEVDQSYYLKNFCDNETFIFISFTEENVGFYTEFGTGDYTYCVNKNDGKMYNIGSKFTPNKEGFINLYLIGMNQYNSFFEYYENGYFNLYRLSFTNELLKIELVFDFRNLPLSRGNSFVDKYGTYSNELFYINKDDDVITKYSDRVFIELSFNDLIYINKTNVFNNGVIEPADFIPTLFKYSKSNYENYTIFINSYENYYIYRQHGLNNYCIITFNEDDTYSAKIEDRKRISYFADRYYFYDYNNILYKYDFVSDEIVDSYEFYDFSFYYDSNKFSATDSDWNKIDGYIDSDGNIHTDMTAYSDNEIKVMFISALN